MPVPKSVAIVTNVHFSTDFVSCTVKVVLKLFTVK